MFSFHKLEKIWEQIQCDLYSGKSTFIWIGVDAIFYAKEVCNSVSV